MSEAALDYVKACPHSNVRGATRKLFEAIARAIPEGHTTTRVIDMDELAEYARIHRGTVVRRLPRLIDIGEIAVLDGGQGSHYARYTMVHLEGIAPAASAELPIIRRVSPRRAPAASSQTPTLFDRPTEHEGSSKRSITSDHKLVWRVITTITSWLLKTITSDHKSSKTITSHEDPAKRSITSDHNDHKLALPLGVDGTRARDVHTFKNVHTHAPPSDEPTKAENTKPPPCRWAGTVHAWCGGRVHVPMELHREFLRKHGRQPHETDADVEATLIAFYERRSATIPIGLRIAVNDFKFWRDAYAEEFPSEASTNRGRPANPRAEPPADLYRLAAAQRHHRRGGGCPHDTMCETTTACIARMVADGRAEREQQTG